MRIVIFTVDHLYANIVVKDLIKSFGKEVVLVVESDVILHNKNLFRSVIKYMEVSGLYYVLTQGFKLKLYKILSRIIKSPDSNFFSFKKLLKKQNIPLKTIFNINKADSVNFIKKYKPDLIISVFFNQILKSEIIKLPKKAIINVHPAYLPNYKGVSPIFWALVSKEKYCGVSVHFINDGIDTGGIIYRKKIKIEKEDTEDSLYKKCAHLGAILLINSINDIKRNKTKILKNRSGTYYSLPTKGAVKIFKDNGRNFFDLKNFIFDN